MPAGSCCKLHAGLKAAESTVFGLKQAPCRDVSVGADFQCQGCGILIDGSRLHFGLII